MRKRKGERVIPIGGESLWFASNFSRRYMHTAPDSKISTLSARNDEVETAGLH